MLFDIHPKETIDSLYGRDDDLNHLINHIENRRWIAILGTRMVGKTSLMKAGKSKIEQKKVPVLYINLWGVSSIKGLLGGIVHAINDSLNLVKKFKRCFNQINGIQVGPLGITIEKRKEPLSLTSEILSVLGNNIDELVIMLDEVQELQYVTAHLVKLLANIFATLPNITFCFTGSYFGLVKSLLEPRFDSPLYGRSPARISVRSFSRDVSKNFLHAGFSENKMRISEKDCNEVVDKFNGIPGWLTLYGNAVVISRLSHEDALKNVEKESFKIQRSVIKHYLEGRNSKLHVTILKAVAAQSTWADLKGSVKAVTGKTINDATLKNIIDALTSSFLIEKTNSMYHTIDPVLRRFLLRGYLI